MLRRLCIAIVMCATTMAIAIEPTAASARTIFVDVNATTVGDGSAAQPFRTVPEALALAGPGDTIGVRPGTYPALTIDSVHGSAGAPITIEGTSDGVVFTDESYSQRFAILIKNSSHLTIHSVTTRHAIAGVMIQSSSGILIDSVQAYDTGQEGMHIQQGSHDITIQNSFIADTGKRTDKVGSFPIGQAPGEGIYVGSGQSNGQDRVWNINILNNEITRTNHEAIDVKAPAHDILITDNHIHEISTFVSGAVVFHLNGFETPDANIVFERNVVDGVVATSPYMDGNCVVVSTAVIIRNNVLTNCQHRGIFIQDGFPTSADRNVLIYHNTLFDTGSVGAMQVKSGSTAQLDIANNLGLDVEGNMPATANDFLDATGGDFSLQPTSPAVDAAPALQSVATDFWSRPRVFGQFADFGAFELGSTSTTTPTTQPVATTAPVDQQAATSSPTPPTTTGSPVTTGPTANPTPAPTSRQGADATEDPAAISFGPPSTAAASPDTSMPTSSDAHRDTPLDGTRNDADSVSNSPESNPTEQGANDVARSLSGQSVDDAAPGGLALLDGNEAADQEIAVVTYIDPQSSPSTAAVAAVGLSLAAAIALRLTSGAQSRLTRNLRRERRGL